ncbi:MAG: adenosine kinase [Nanoarchaeota archaeon]
MPQFDAYGIGNSLIDFVVDSDEDFLARFDLKKGVMQLVDQHQFIDVMNHLKKKKVTILPGGSAANTMIGMSRLGAKTAYSGKVGDDFHAQQYINGLKKAGVKPNVISEKGITGTCISLVTKDKERTMATCLAKSSEMEPDDINWTELGKAKLIHLEGYQLNTPNQTQVMEQAMAFAKQKGILVSFDCADPFVVKRYKEEIKRIISKYADIIFLNEAEAKELTGLHAAKAIKKIGKKDHIVALKLGKKGSLIKKGNKIIKIPIHKVKAIDTTGAGDLFAAGMLYGISKGASLKECGMYASFLAGKIVSQYGAYLGKIDERGLKKWMKH